MKNSHLIVLLLPVLCALGCDDDNGGDGGGDMGVAEQATALFGQVIDIDGAPVAGARVMAGGAEATADADGRFQTRMGAGDVVVRIEAAGHLPQIREATIFEGEATAVEVRMMREAAAVPLDAGAGGEVDGDRGARVVVPAGALVGADGSPVGGMVDVHLTPLDPSVRTQLEAAPGDLSARDAGGASAKLVSYGMLDITMRQGDETLQLAPGQLMQIQIPAPMGAVDPPAEMPLWSFDEAQALWIEEGTLTYDAEAGVYVGEIGHMSYWNADVAQETACITGRVVDADGQPVPGAQISSRGIDYNGYDTAHADADGRFLVLARVNSAVGVLASHGQGGIEREVMTNGTVVAQPVADLDACVDGGEWVIERGVVQFADGTVAECDAQALTDFSACIPLLVELGQCHNPQGTCTIGEGSGLFDFDYSYSNGARIETTIDSETFAVTTRYFGPGGVECGSQTTNTQGAAGGRIDVALPDGRSASYGLMVDINTRAVTYTCADGSSRTLTADDQAVLQACSGGVDDPDAECEGEIGGGPGNTGEVCDSDAECADGNTCCVGVCIAEDLCPLGGRVCETSETCDEGDVCCPGAGRCLARDRCVETGWCEGDGDCGGGGLCCDNRCVDDGRPTCEGECSADVGCGGDLPYCCMRDDFDRSRCVQDAGSCHNYQACAPDAAESVCAGEADGTPLVCCGEGDDAVCRSTGECFGGEACGGPDDCGGADAGLICCDSDANGARDTCAAGADCYSGTPCGPEAACPGSLYCCERFMIDPELPGACFESEGMCNLGQPCAGQADCGAGAHCCADPGFAEPVCLQDDSGCMDVLP